MKIATLVIRKPRSDGFSLIETSMVLLIIGVIGLGLWRLLPHLLDTGRSTQRYLDRIEEAIDGFILANNRLPCPASETGGNEDCSVSDGLIPWQTLGLPASPARDIRYTVSIRLSSVPETNTFRPSTPPGTVYMPTLNGLDFCAQIYEGGSISVGDSVSVSVAYALAAPGPDGIFSSANTGGFTLPGTPGTDDGDDLVRAAGTLELAARLSCPQRMASVNATSAAAWGAYENDRVSGYGVFDSDGITPRISAGMYVRFRDLVLYVREGNVEMADVNLGLAVANLYTASATASTSLVLALTTKSAGTASAVAAGAVVAAAAGKLASATLSKLQTDKQYETAAETACNALRYAERVKYESDSITGRTAEVLMGIDCTDVFLEGPGEAYRQATALESDESGGILP